MERMPDGLGDSKRQVNDRFETASKMGAGALALNWGFGPRPWLNATLLPRGIRSASPADVPGRGTFSHRHAVCTTRKDAAPIFPWPTCRESARFDIYDSLAV